MDHVFGIISEKASLYPRAYRFFPRSFIVLHFIFRSMIHRVLNFVALWFLNSVFPLLAIPIREEGLYNKPKSHM